MTNRVMIALALAGLCAASVMAGMAYAQNGDEGTEVPPVPRIELIEETLPNGMRVILQCDDTVPRVAVALAYHVGSKNERAGRTGFAHFFEHMMFRGTKNVPNYDVPLREAGAGANAFTSQDVTCYIEEVPAEFLERALYLEAERMAFLPSALDQEKFDTEREVVKNERRQSYENRPYGLASEVIEAALYPEGHPYSWSVIGSMADLDRSSLDDLRDFFARFYHPGNATLALVGDLDPERTLDLVRQYFGPIPSGPEVGPVQAPDSEAPTREIERGDQVRLSRLYQTWRAVSETHPDAPALTLLGSILSTGETSRLVRSLVREQRLATSVSAGFFGSEIDGQFQVVATATPDLEMTRLKAELTEELDRIRQQPPTRSELARARARTELSLYNRLTGLLGRATRFATDAAKYNDPDRILDEASRYAEVTPEDIRRVAEIYLDDKVINLVIRPLAPDEKEAPAVQVGPLADGRGDREVDRERLIGDTTFDWSTLPGPSKPEPFEPPSFTRHTLSNGMDVWIAPWTNFPIAQVQLIVRAGSRDVDPTQAGLARLLASCLNQGTKSMDSEEFADALAELGVDLGIFAGRDSTSIAFTTLTRNLEPAMGLVGQVLATPRFDVEDVAREQALQVASILSGPDSPNWIAGRAFPALLYGPDSPYGYPEQGTTASVERLTADDLRAFHKAHFRPGNASLILAGDVDPDVVIGALERSLADWSGEGEDAEGPEEPGSLEPVAETRVVYLADKRGAVQSVLSVGSRWRARDAESEPAARLGNDLFGGNFLSRLNQNLRERNGYTYGAGSRFRYRDDGSTWEISTSVQTDATGPALAEIVAELVDVSGAGDNPPSNAEVIEAREAAVRSYPRAFATPSGIAAQLAEIAIYDLPETYLQEELDHLRAVTPGAVRKVMATLAEPSRQVLLVVGDRAVIEPQLRAAGFDHIVLVDVGGRPVNKNDAR